MPALKNNRHELFAQGLAQGKPASEAHVFAGYRRNRHNASTLSKNKTILKRIAEIQAPALKRAEVTIERLAEELAHISTIDVSEVLRVTGTKVYLLKPLADLPKAITATIAALKSTKDGLEVKFHDKLTAIRLLGNHKGMFKENINLSVEVSLADLVNASLKAEDKPKDKA
jgi:phage terminase small subunit